MLRQLIACDPSGLKTLAIAIKANQGTLAFGCLITLAGERALLPSHGVGILSRTVHTDSEFFHDNEAAAIYTGGRFNWAAVTRANPTIVFDELSISGLAARGITFEAMYSGAPNWWISLPH
jgi:hypothetical protein